jgi:hypothetical protein
MSKERGWTPGDAGAPGGPGVSQRERDVPPAVIQPAEPVVVPTVQQSFGRGGPVVDPAPTSGPFGHAGEAPNEQL